MASAAFDRARLAARAEEGWITVTELADTLTRDHGVPFKTSHKVASRFVAECERRPDAPRAGILREVSTAVLGRAVEYDDAALTELLSARHFVNVRTTPGGPAPSETARAIEASRALPEIRRGVAYETTREAARGGAAPERSSCQRSDGGWPWSG